MATARRLQAKDVFTAARVFANAREDILRAVMDLRAEHPDASEKEVGMAIGGVLLQRADTDVHDWLADLAQKTPAEFDAMPLEELLGLIEQLVDNEDWPGFFSRVTGLANRRNASGTVSRLATAGAMETSSP